MAYGDPNPPTKDPNCEPGRWIPGLTLTEKYPEPPVPIPTVVLPQQTIQTYKNNYVSVYSDQYTSSLKEWFTETTMSWIRGDGLIYSPDLNQELTPKDVWKWDLSGESEYGLVEPPVNEPNYDLFDSNWAAQFVVFGPGDGMSCKSLDLDWCSWSPTTRPKRGPDTDIHQNCPAQSAKPTEPEPSYLDLYKAYLETNECEKIEKVLGPQYLGCIWSDPKHPCSCNCPEQGVSFADYLAATRTYATFWDTPHYTPLHRAAQVGQLTDNIIKINLSKTTRDLKLGDIVNIIQKDNIKYENPLKNSGNWMVASITHQFSPYAESGTTVTLIRDTNNINFQSSEMGWEPIYLNDWEEIS